MLLGVASANQGGSYFSSRQDKFRGKICQIQRYGLGYQTKSPDDGQGFAPTWGLPCNVVDLEVHLYLRTVLTSFPQSLHFTLLIANSISLLDCYYCSPERLFPSHETLVCTDLGILAFDNCPSTASVNSVGSDEEQRPKLSTLPATSLGRVSLL